MNKTQRKVLGLFLLLGIFAIAGAYFVAFKGNTTPLDKDYFYIRHDDTYARVRENLIQKKVVKNARTFDLVATQMNLPNTYKPGRYKIEKELNNVELVRKIRQGNWDKVIVKVPIEMTREQVVAHLAEKLEPSKDEIREALNGDWMQQNGFTSENRWSVFLPDRYHFNWATPADKVVGRFVDEYTSFWTASRKQKARVQGLTTKEAVVLASIVDGEAIHIDEMPIIAGLYLNRLKKGQLLQSDPTVLYVVGREGRKRVLYSDLRQDHPYNTYKTMGLPPGPLFAPDKRAIDAVLNPVKHKYIFMCARPDGSYRHNFTASITQHNRNAAAYRRSLDRRGVRR
ncbi:MAG: endolytic transglycosylase MltG [Bacteroidia bacterium]|nr:endolytic transglycosylase MltG [Bacteroidia bacterium]